MFCADRHNVKRRETLFAAGTSHDQYGLWTSILESQRTVGR